MAKFWSIDSPVMNGLGMIADIIILNILFIVCCLPVVTAGASLSALYTVTLKMARKEYPAIFKGFFQAFKKNFRISTISWFITVLISGIMILDLRIVGLIGGTAGTALKILLGIVLLIWVMTVTYLYPYIARFENTVKNTFKNAFMMSIAHLPLTILMVGLSVGIGVIVFFSARNFVIATIVGFFAGFAALAYIKSLLFTKIFKKYE